MTEGVSHARKFRLPGVEELTKEQEEVLALPREGCHLIVGGPGTGKTVVCLLRARRLARDGGSYRFLVWNRLLRQSSGALLDGNLRRETWESWFPRVFQACVGEEIPRGASSNGYSPIDWSATKEAMKGAGTVNEVCRRPLYLVIDEGQDMPPDFYYCLAQLGFEHFFVAMDQNQQIGKLNCSREDLRNNLGLSPGK